MCTRLKKNFFSVVHKLCLFVVSKCTLTGMCLIILLTLSISYRDGILVTFFTKCSFWLFSDVTFTEKATTLSNIFKKESDRVHSA